MRQPYDNHGRKVPMACPRSNCGNGKLQPDGPSYWMCDGLADPGRDDKPLEACTFMHIDGEPYEP